MSGYSWHGALHDLYSLTAFVALAAACFVFGRRFAARSERGWATYTAVTGVVFVGAFVLSSAGFGQAEGLRGTRRAVAARRGHRRLRLADTARRPLPEIVFGEVTLV